MNRKDPRRGRNFAVGGSVIGSVIGDGNSNTSITVHSIGETGAVALEDLQEAIALLWEQVEAAGGSETADGRLRYEFEIIEEELDEEEPDGAAVRSRWKQAQKLLGPLQHVAGIAHSTEQIIAMIRTLFGGN